MKRGLGLALAALLALAPSLVFAQPPKPAYVTGSPTTGAMAKASGPQSVTTGDLSGDCTTSGTLAITCTKTGGAAFGTFATQNYAAPPAIGASTPASGTFSSLKDTGVTGSTQCAQFDTAGLLSGTGSACGSGGATTGRLIGLQIFTSGSGTYTPASGTTSIIVELIGGGGGGGSVASPTGSNAYLASGGQAGGWLKKRLTASFSGAPYAVGAKGTGATSGGSVGNAGSDTTFTTTGGSPVTYTAKGGAGGTKNGAFAPPFLVGLPTPNITTGGDFAKSGELGSLGLTLSLFNTASGGGGNGPYGYGGGAIFLGSNNASTAGSNAGGSGGGGGGAAANGTGSAQAGGNGSDGSIIIWEFS